MAGVTRLDKKGMKHILVSYLLPWKPVYASDGSITGLQEYEDRTDIGYAIVNLKKLYPPAVLIGLYNADLFPASTFEHVSALFKTQLDAHLVHVEAQDTIKMHNQYANEELRRILYYQLIDRPVNLKFDSHRLWSGFVALQQAFADKIVEIYEPGDLIWIHDYPLILVPQMVKSQLSQACIGFYFHSVFPSSEIFRCLAQRSELLHGVLGSSLIGFQAYSYARHFLSSCSRILGLESTPSGVRIAAETIRISIFPYGIVSNQLSFNQDSHADFNPPESVSVYPEMKLIIGKDTSDQLSGVYHKLLGFERFLSEYPHWLEKVILIQLIVDGNTTDKKLEMKVLEAVARINASYGSMNYQPIQCLFQRLTPDEYFPFLKKADVALITSERDSLNLTAYEYIIAQKEHKNPLIISEFTGNAGTLSTAYLVNPWDPKEIADALNDALSLNEEEKNFRHSILYACVSKLTIENWASSFIEELTNTCNSQLSLLASDRLDLTLFKEAYNCSQQRLFLLDYDGTLAPIEKLPEAAAPSPSLIAILTALCSDPQNKVFVVSGRSMETLDLWLGKVPNLGLSAEHGSFIKMPEINAQWVNLAEGLDLSWQSEVLQIFQHFTERTPGSFIEEKQVSIVWHYRLADQDFGNWQLKECKNLIEKSLLTKLPIELIAGKKNLEARPALMNKGQVTRRIVSLFERSLDFIFSSGDDRTDEDMFQALNELSFENVTVKKVSVITCRVGIDAPASHAKYFVDEPKDLVKILSMVCK